MNEADLADLIAYLDGELAPDARRAIEDRLAVEPDLAEALAGISANDALLSMSLDIAAGNAEAHVPGQPLRPLLAAIDGLKRLRRGVGLGWPGLAATTVGLIVGIVIGQQYAWTQDDIARAELRASRAVEARAAQQAMSQALEQHTSGETVDWKSPDTGRHVAVTPVRTFRSERGQWCREFTQVVVDGSLRTAVRGIACRQGEGDWRAMLWRPDESAG